MRFIPVCMGNTSRSRQFSNESPVHPRMHGEHIKQTCPPANGSSPYARGTQREYERMGRSTRFIPVCTGNTLPVATNRSFNAGSSPYARGTPPVQADEIHVRRFIPVCTGTQAPLALASEKGTVRFIPMCVGNTRGKPGASTNWWVHPHVRGEYKPIGCSNDASYGSSPCAWGIHNLPGYRACNGRFIPMCVGNTAYY